MKKAPQSSPNNKPEGTTLGTAFFVVVALAILVIVGLVAGLYYLRGENRRINEELAAADRRAKQHELEQKAGAEQLRLDRAQARQTEVLRQARAATNALEKLLAEVNATTAEATTLKTNLDGQRLALHPDLLTQARLFFEGRWREVPSTAAVTSRLEDARRVEQQMLTQQGTAFEPPAETLKGVETATVAAEREYATVKQIRDYLASLVRESKVKYTQATLTTNAPRLEDAIQITGNAEAVERQRKAAEQTAAATAEADRIRAEEKSKQIIADAERDAAKVRAEAEAKKAALEREMALMKAEQQKEAVKATVAIETAADEARKVQLRKKASDPQIQAKLAPFITPGTVGIYKRSYDNVPLSYTEMQSCGALAPTVRGLDRLAIIATCNDKVRPRWDINPKLYSRSPTQLEMVKEAQQLLIELGPVLVEMGKLLP